MNDEEMKDDMPEIRDINNTLHRFAMDILIHRNSAYRHGEFDPDEQSIIHAYELATNIVLLGSRFEFEPFEGMESMRSQRIKYKQSQEGGDE